MWVPLLPVEQRVRLEEQRVRLEERRQQEEPQQRVQLEERLWQMRFVRPGGRLMMLPEWRERPPPRLPLQVVGWAGLRQESLVSIKRWLLVRRRLPRVVEG